MPFESLDGVFTAAGILTTALFATSSLSSAASGAQRSLRLLAILSACLMAIAAVSRDARIALGLLELGHDPATGRVDAAKADAAVAEMDAFARSFLKEVRVDPRLGSTMDELGSRLSTFDFGNLYDVLPERQAGTPWRGIGVVGRRAARDFHLDLADPALAAWQAGRDGAAPGSWRAPARFGDGALRLFVRPEKADTFLMNAEGSISFGAMPVANIARVTAAVLAGMQAQGAAAGPDGDLEDALAQELPRLWAELSSRLDVEVSAAPRVWNGVPYAELDIDGQLDVARLAKDFPALAGFFDSLRGAIVARVDVAGKDGVVARLFFDARSYRFAARALVRDGELLFADANRRPTTGRGIAPLTPARHELTAKCDVLLNLKGVEIKLKSMSADLVYAPHAGGPFGSVRLHEAPRSVSVGGRAFGVLPVWMIDALIPSNLEDIVKAYLATMATGNGGRGAVLEAGVFPGGAPERLALRAGQEVLANGFIRLALEIQASSGAFDPAVHADLKRLLLRSWTAFESDYKRLRAQREGQAKSGS